MDFLQSLMHLEVIITILIGLAAFATVLTVTAPLLENDKLKARMKALGEERQRMRAAQRAALGGETRLRDNRPKDVASQLVELLNLRKLFEAETSREMLRQAGMRSERHLIVFLTIRFAMPIFLAIIVFVYASTVFADRISPPMRLGATFAGVLVGYYLPTILLKNKVTHRQVSIKSAWSDALDLLLICVESGMAIEPAMSRVAREIGAASVPLAEEMTLTVAELSYLPERRRAYENLGKRTGLPIVKSVVTSLIQSERYGTPLGTALRVLAQENRDARMQEAERKAAALPPKLTVPMILFFLPVIFVIILGPSAIKVMKLN